MYAIRSYYVALSFVRWAKDITDLREIIKKRNKKTLIVAKIEKPEALEELDAIIEASDAVMVVITSYSIHYTKLYDFLVAESAILGTYSI